MKPRQFWISLVIILFLAAGIRLQSFFWNNVPHGYMWEDRAAAVSFAKYRTLQIEPPTTTPYFYSLSRGRWLDQHPPLWPVMSAAVLLLTGNTSLDIFFIFRVFSWLSGLALIVALALLARGMISKEAGIWAALFAAGSYLLIDYSGNGALYIFQGFLYLAWLLVVQRLSVIDFSSTTPWSNQTFALAILALVSALGLMLNYQAIALFAATGLLILFNFNYNQADDETPPPAGGPPLARGGGYISPPFKEGFRGWSHRWSWLKARLPVAAIFTGLFIIFSSPLLIRNYSTFGSPLYNVNMEYTFLKAGIEPVVKGDLLVFPSRLEAYVAVAKSTITFWLPRNLYYISRKLFILAPGLFIAFVFALIDYLFSRELRKKMLPVLLVLLFHTVISAMWPITKFRYFVPLLPLVIIIGLEGMWRYFPKPKARTAALSACLAVLLIFSWLTYRSTPGHTYYYDGAITTDPYSGQGELEWYRDNSVSDNSES